MEKGLRKYFPNIQTREAILREIAGNDQLSKIYSAWNEEQKERFLECCTGQKGVRVLYDSFFKEILDPETKPERMDDFLSEILGQKVSIISVLPLESPRIGGEKTLVVMDLVVKLADKSIVNVEIQRFGYLFPGQRAACYSADLLLRQYKKIRSEKKKSFSYKDIKKVYTIILYEKSTSVFHKYPNQYIHHFSQCSDTGIKMDLLQEYIFIPLDIFRTILHNNNIGSKREAWLTFLSSDEPAIIESLILKYPEFQKYYGEIYELCCNMEKVMEMFSQELQELDENTVQYMIDEMQDALDAKQTRLEEQMQKIDRLDEEIQRRDAQITEQETRLTEQEAQITEQETRLTEQEVRLTEQEAQITEQEAQITEQETRLTEQEARLTEQEVRLTEQEAQLEEQERALQESADEIQRLKKLLREKMDEK